MAGHQFACSVIFLLCCAFALLVAKGQQTVVAQKECASVKTGSMKVCFNGSKSVIWSFEEPCETKAVIRSETDKTNIQCLDAKIGECGIFTKSRGGFTSYTSSMVGRALDGSDSAAAVETCLTDEDTQLVPTGKATSSFMVLDDVYVAAQVKPCIDALCKNHITHPMTLDCQDKVSVGDLGYCKKSSDFADTPSVYEKYKFIHLRFEVLTSGNYYVMPSKCFAQSYGAKASEAIQILFDGCHGGNLKFVDDLPFPIHYPVHSERVSVLKIPVTRLQNFADILYYLYCEVAICSGPNCYECSSDVLKATNSDGSGAEEVQTRDMGIVLGFLQSHIGDGPLIVLGDPIKEVGGSDWTAFFRGPVAPILFTLIGLVILAAICFPIVRTIQIRRRNKKRHSSAVKTDAHATVAKSLTRLRAKQMSKVGMQIPLKESDTLTEVSSAGCVVEEDAALDKSYGEENKKFEGTALVVDVDDEDEEGEPDMEEGMKGLHVNTILGADPRNTMGSVSILTTKIGGSDAANSGRMVDTKNEKTYMDKDDADQSNESSPVLTLKTSITLDEDYDEDDPDIMDVGGPESRINVGPVFGATPEGTQYTAIASEDDIDTFGKKTGEEFCASVRASSLPSSAHFSDLKECGAHDHYD